MISNSLKPNRNLLPALKVADVERMDFSSLVGIANEPNTPSGAHGTIRKILREIPLSGIERILDIGCNTGFATIEFASWVNAEVTGVDLNEISLAFAAETARLHRLKNAKFCKANLLDLPFPDNYFDLVYCNNVTSFVNSRKAAALEYFRVLRPGGVLAVVPIYYLSMPEAGLIDEVSQAIGAPIDCRGKEQWHECFDSPDSHLIHEEDFTYDDIPAGVIVQYVERVMNAPHIQEQSVEVQKAIQSRLAYFYQLFNRNLQHCGYSIMIFRWKQPNSFPVLFKSRAV